MTMKTQAMLVGPLACLSVVGVAADAHAGVSNPGTFDFNIPSGQDSRFRFRRRAHESAVRSTAQTRDRRRVRRPAPVRVS